MPVKLYSYIEKREVWMLTEEEFARLPPQEGLITHIKEFREKHGVSLKEALDSVENMPSAAMEAYEEITGERVLGLNVIYGRRLSLFGPICSYCGKPYRTPKASKCVERECTS